MSQELQKDCDSVVLLYDCGAALQEIGKEFWIGLEW